MRRKINQLDLEVTQVIELREKTVKTAMISIVHMFKYVQRNMSSFRRDMDYIKKDAY